MRAMRAALAAVLLAACAVAAGGATGRTPAVPHHVAPIHGGAPPRVGARIPVSVLPGAVPGGKALPVPTLGSPYLHLRERTYETSRTPDQIYSYYAPLLAAQGFAPAMPSEFCGAPPQCWKSWDFSRGQLQLFVLSTRPLAAKKTRFSLTMERIIPPPRPAASYVPKGAGLLFIQIRPTAGAAWRYAVVTSPAAVARFRRLVNGLAVRAYSVHSCLPDPGSAVLRFVAFGASYTYEYNASCAYVKGPEKMLLDGNQALWNAMLRAAGG